MWTTKVACGSRCNASSTRESVSASATTCCIASGVIGYTEISSMFATSVEWEICPSVYARSPMPARSRTNAKLPIASRWASDRSTYGHDCRTDAKQDCPPSLPAVAQEDAVLHERQQHRHDPPSR